MQIFKGEGFSSVEIERLLQLILLAISKGFAQPSDTHLANKLLRLGDDLAENKEDFLEIKK